MTRKIAYDISRMQPGCVIVQAGMGVTDTSIASEFDTQDWLLAPTK